jgi:hypothetical protein
LRNDGNKKLTEDVRPRHESDKPGDDGSGIVLS